MSSSVHKKTVAVSGAGGYIGRAVVAELLRCGHNVSALVHAPHSVTHDDSRVQWIVGDLRDPDTVGRFVASADIVVHLASRKSDERDSEEVNICGAKNLVDACEAAGVSGIINVSTISTKLANAGVYGKTKRAADQIIAASSVPSRTLLLSVVYDNAGGGIFGTLMRYARLPAIPVIGSGDVTFHPIHVDDVGKAIALLVASPMAGHRTYELGGPDRVSFNELAQMIGRKVCGSEPRLIHLPFQLAKLLAKLFRLFLTTPPITTSNVLGMGEELDVDSSAFVHDHDFHPRSLSAGLALLHSPMRKRRTQADVVPSEASALLAYVSGGFPKETSMKAYNAAVAHFGLAEHHISSRILGSPLLLGAFDAVSKLTKPRGMFQRKMLIAAALYECSPESSDKLLPQERSVGSLLSTGVLCVIRSGAKLSLGLVLVCIPGFYERNA